MRPNSALHPAASSRTRQRRSGHVLCSRYPRSSPGSWPPTKKKQALTASSPIVGLARIDLAQSLAMHVTSRSRQCHLMVRCELGHGRGSVCQSWMRPDHLTISPSHHQVTDPVGGFVMACSHSQSLQVSESKRQPCNSWLAQPFGKRVHLSAAIRHGYIQFADQKTTPWEVEDPSNRQQSRRWQGIRQKRREKRPATPPQTDPHLPVPPLCTFTLSKVPSGFMLHAGSRLLVSFPADGRLHKVRYLPRSLSWVNPSMRKGVLDMTWNKHQIYRLFLGQTGDIHVGPQTPEMGLGDMLS